MLDVSFADFIFDNFVSNSAGETGWLFINGKDRLGFIFYIEDLNLYSFLLLIFKITKNL